MIARLLTLLILLTTTLPASAQPLAPLELNLPEDNIVRLEQKTKTKNDYISIYYDYCISANTAPEMKTYTKAQCTCTAANMHENMTNGQIQSIFGTGANADFNYARMLLIAYSPCLKTTIKDITYDGCITPQRTNHSLCTCMGEELGQKAYESIEVMVPGFTRNGFSKANSVADPLGAVLLSRNFEYKTDKATRRCNQLREQTLYEKSLKPSKYLPYRSKGINE